MAEKEGEHTRETQSKALHAAIIEHRLGQWFALAITLAGFAGAGYLAVQGHDGVAIALATAPLSTIVLAFLNRKAKQDSPH